MFYMCLLFLRFIIDMTSVCSWKSLLEKAMNFELYVVISFYFLSFTENVEFNTKYKTFLGIMATNKMKVIVE